MYELILEFPKYLIKYNISDEYIISIRGERYMDDCIGKEEEFKQTKVYFLDIMEEEDLKEIFLLFLQVLEEDVNEYCGCSYYTLIEISVISDNSLYYSFYSLRRKEHSYPCW